jgi:hypothetical protein
MAVRTPPPPRAPRAPQLPRAHILPRQPEPGENPEVPWQSWREFNTTHTFEQGDHVTGIGRTGRGKTTLFARGLLPHYPFVVYLGTKEDDPSAYPWLLRHGFKMTTDPRLDYRRAPRVIYRPGPFGISKKDKEIQAERFAAVLAVAYAQRRWAIYADEVAYLDEIGLAVELEAIWRTGRGRKITMLAASQNPVSIPRVAFDQVSHLFFWRQTEAERVRRMGEMAGDAAATVREAIRRLPEYEALYVNTTTDELVRTRYAL